MLHLFFSLFLAFNYAESIKLSTSNSADNYDNPVTASPIVKRPEGVKVCTSGILTNKAFKDYGVHRTTYTPPTIDGKKCDISQATLIVLDWEAKVAGRQFDRYGSIVINKSEIFRFSTPEPTPQGIHWQAEVDVTDYRSLFQNPQNVFSTLPNVINKLYTGVIYANATISFYLSAHAMKVNPPLIIPLYPYLASPEEKETPNHESNLYNERFLKIEESDDFKWTNLQVNNPVESEVEIPSNAVSMSLNIHTSAHGCEEFWYQNTPTTKDTKAGECAKGSFRNLQVFIDGQMVGQQLPFPVIYTGGVCPSLWRPVTGLQSFHILPHKFDLTAALGLINDGETHRFSYRIFNGVEKDTHIQSTWISNADLFVEVDSSQTKIEKTLLSYDLSYPVFSLHKKSKGPVSSYDTFSFSKLSMTSLIVIGNRRKKATTNYSIISTNKNTFNSTMTNVVKGKEITKRDTTVFYWKDNEKPEVFSYFKRNQIFPYTITTVTIDKDKYFSLDGQVKYAFEDFSLYKTNQDGNQNEIVSSRHVIDTLDSHGFLSESKITSQHIQATGSAQQNSMVLENKKLCYHHGIKANDGKVLDNTIYKNDC